MILVPKLLERKIITHMQIAFITVLINCKMNNEQAILVQNRMTVMYCDFLIKQHFFPFSCYIYKIIEI